MSNNLVARYLLSGHGFSAAHWLKFHNQNNRIPDFIMEQIQCVACSVTKKQVKTLVCYHKSVGNREHIYLNLIGIKAFLVKAGHGELPENHRKILERILQEAIDQNLGLSNGSPVLPFKTTVITAGAKTGRDTTKGASINGLPKVLWNYTFAPPTGFSYVLFDFESNEPAIIAAMSGAKDIQRIYQQGDLYDALNQKITEGRLERGQFKLLFIKHIYGQSAFAIAKGMELNKETAFGWIAKLKPVTKILRKFLDDQLVQAKKTGEIKSKDWRMTLNAACTDFSLRNWPIQACGADIMRRACLALEAAGLPVLLTNHDAFLVKIETKNIDQQCTLATKILGDASAEVLDGFRLKVKTDLIVNHLTLRN